MKRIFINHEQWEDYQSGLYLNKNQNYKFLVKSIELLLDQGLLKSAMERVLSEWKVCSQVHMTNLSKNRKAWLGQAACCLNHGANEETVKEAWNKLDKADQDSANEIAANIIKKWEEEYAEKLS